MGFISTEELCFMHIRSRVSCSSILPMPVRGRDLDSFLCIICGGSSGIYPCVLYPAESGTMAFFPRSIVCSEASLTSHHVCFVEGKELQNLQGHCLISVSLHLSCRHDDSRSSALHSSAATSSSFTVAVLLFFLIHSCLMFLSFFL